MAADPAFAVTPRIGFGAVSTVNTNRDGTGTIVDILTGAAGGTRIHEVVIQATGDPADSCVTLFLWNGAAYQLRAEFDIDNPAAASVTVSGYTDRRIFDNLILPDATWKLAAAITAAPVSGVVNVFAFSGNLVAV